MFQLKHSIDGPTQLRCSKPYKRSIQSIKKFHSNLDKVYNNLLAKPTHVFQIQESREKKTLIDQVPADAYLHLPSIRQEGLASKTASIDQ